MPLHKKILTADQLADLHDWLYSQNINPQRIRREYSDVLPVATLMKKNFPKLVDLFNYPKQNSFKHKLANWETFNFKVLAKVGLVASKPFLENLAKCTQGSIDVLLYEIMMIEHREKLRAIREAELQQEEIWAENDEVRMVNVSKQIGDGIVQVPQKMILYSLYEQVLRDSQSKDAVVENYHNRVEHLDNILKLKSERIQELSAQIAKKPQINDNNNNNKSTDPLLDRSNSNASRSSSSLVLTGDANRVQETAAVSAISAASSAPKSILKKPSATVGIKVSGVNKESNVKRQKTASKLPMASKGPKLLPSIASPSESLFNAKH